MNIAPVPIALAPCYPCGAPTAPMCLLLCPHSAPAHGGAPHCPCYHCCHPCTYGPWSPKCCP